MKLHRFIGDFDFSKKRFRITDKEMLNQIRNVLRLKVGGQVILVDKNKHEAAAQIKDLAKDSAEFEVNATTENEKEPKIHTTLFCAVLKKENFELVVQKATECGVTEIVPIISARTIKLALRKDRLAKIAKEAAEQSGRGRIPVIGDIVTLGDAMNRAKEFEANLFFEPGAPLFSAERLRNSQATTASVFIGPEGGWDDEEIKAARVHDLKVIGLGGLTLRAETAAIIASFLTANASNF